MADNNLTTKEEFLLNPVEEHNITDAAVASFETNLKHPLQVTVPITPQQDLHGMPNPYPAGASVNLIPDGTDTSNGYVDNKFIVADGTLTSASNYYVSEYFEVEPETEYTWSSREYAYASPGLCFYDENKTYLSGFNASNELPKVITTPSNAAYCRASQDKRWLTERIYGLQFELGTASTEFRGYSNICPIEGSLGIEIYGTRRQLFDKTKLIHGSYFGANGILTANSVSGHCFVKVYGLQYITISGSSGWSAARCCFFDENKRYISGNDVKMNRTLAVPSNAYYFGASCLDQPSRSDYDLDTYMIEPGRVAHNYETVNNKIPITFTDPSTGDPMTVYGGTLTLNEDGSADLLTTYVSRKISQMGVIKSTGTTEPWTHRYVLRYYVSGKGYDFNQQTWYLDRFPKGNANSNYTAWQSGQTIYVYDNTVSTANEFVEKWGDAQIVYSVNNYSRKTYHFSNVGQLKAFLGENNVWSDIGNVNVKYLTQHSETGLEYRGDRALELRRRAMMADAPTIHTTIGSEETGGLASFKSYVKAPVKKIEIPFSPKQDLHGYDHPWPGGVSINLFNPDATTDNTRLNNVGVIISYTGWCVSDWIPVTENTYYFASNTIPSANGYSMCFYDENKNFLRYYTVSGGGGLARDSGNDAAYLRVTVNLSTKASTIVAQSSSNVSFVPYANICPISGWTGANIGHAPTDYFSAYESSTSGINRVPLGNGETIRIYGTATASGGYTISEDFPVNSTSLTLIGFPAVNVSGTGFCLWDVTTSKVVGDSFKNGQVQVRTVNTTHTYRIGFTIGNGQAIDITFTPKVVDTDKLQTLPIIFNQSGDHAILPTQEGTGDPSPENVRPIHPGLTFTRDDNSVLSIYDGALTVNADGTGSLSETYNLADLSELGFAWNNSTQTFRTPVKSDIDYSTDASGIANILCSALKPTTAGHVTSTDLSIGINTAGNIVAKWAEYDNDNSGFISAITGFKLLYATNTSTTYALSVTETNRALEALGLIQHIGSLYGGTIAINQDGSADVEVAKAVTDMGDFTWTYNTAGAYSFFMSQRVDAIKGTHSLLTLMCSNYKAVINRGYTDFRAGDHNNEICCSRQPGYTVVMVQDSRYTDANTFKDAVTGVTLVYDLATPSSPIHFSNLEQLKVWLGENNFWCDISDDITVKYWNRG